MIGNGKASKFWVDGWLENNLALISVACGPLPENWQSIMVNQIMQDDDQ